MPKLTKLKKSSIIYKNIDFLKLKIDNSLFDYFLNNSYAVYNKLSILDLNLNDFNGVKLFGKYFIVNFGEIGNTKHRFDILDIDKNKVGNVIFATKEYKSNISYIEFSGLFFKTNDLQISHDQNLPYLKRFSYLSDFLDYFSINIYQYNVLKNIQYCIDISGKEAFQIINMLKSDKDYKGLPIDGLTAFDYLKLQEKKGVVQYGKTKTGFTIPSTYNKLIIYDKILDILQNYLSRKVDGINPYDSYIKSSVPITRIELSKKTASFSHIKDNSINFIFNNIDALFFDFLPRYFLVDFRKISLVHIDSLNGKSIHFAERQKQIKLLHSISMFKAYGKNIKNLLGDGAFQKLSLEVFPELDGIKSMDFVDEFELWEIKNTALSLSETYDTKLDNKKYNPSHYLPIK